MANVTLTYISWDGKQKTWEPATEGTYFIRVKEKIVNADGSYFNQSALGHFSKLNDVKTAWKAILCVRPDLKGIVQPVKALCQFDIPHSCVVVETWL